MKDWELIVRIQETGGAGEAFLNIPLPEAGNNE